MPCRTAFPVAYWAKPLLIGHSACWLTGGELSLARVQIQVWKGVFQLI